MRLIDADAFERRVMFDSDIEDLQDVIYALRDYESIADAVPVVRCKDCKYWGTIICECWDGIEKTDAEWYCADGERRET